MADTTISRPSTPPPSRPIRLLSRDFRTYLLENEIPVMDGPLAPPRNGMEIRKCYECNQVNLIVHYTSSKKKCGYCTHY